MLRELQAQVGAAAGAAPGTNTRIAEETETRDPATAPRTSGGSGTGSAVPSGTSSSSSGTRPQSSIVTGSSVVTETTGYTEGLAGGGGGGAAETRSSKQTPSKPSSGVGLVRTASGASAGSGVSRLSPVVSDTPSRPASPYGVIASPTTGAGTPDDDRPRFGIVTAETGADAGGAAAGSRGPSKDVPSIPSEPDI